MESEVVPSIIPGGTEIPWSDWEGPGILYLKSGELVLSNFNGSQKSLFTSVPGFGPWPPSFSPETGRIVAESASSLWVVDLGQEPQNLLSLSDYIESPVISSDGRKIAYSLASGFGDEDIQQLWTINPDGSENTLVINNTSQYITDPGPFRLRPIAWSLDNTKVYMVTTTDSEATPAGMYVADLTSGTIEKAMTPQVTLWDISFSPDRTKVAYKTFQWIPVPNSMPEVGPPFTLNVTDLYSGDTRILLENETDQYFQPVWSGDGNRLAYTVRQDGMGGDLGIYAIDLTTGVEVMVVPGSENSRLRPWGWLSEDRLAYAQGDLSSGNIRNPVTTLYTISIQGTEKYAIDSEVTMVLGVVDK